MGVTWSELCLSLDYLPKQCKRSWIISHSAMERAQVVHRLGKRGIQGYGRGEFHLRRTSLAPRKIIAYE
jgi:hypothetical protein